MGTPRLAMFDRLPEIYRIRDTEQDPPGQLQAYLGAIDRVQTALHDDIAALYLDFFIETCNPWVIPYIADLVGTSHLAGDPHDLRADVARTVRNRRRKGTLGAVESVVFALSGWAVSAVEMRERLLWAQHLNHQRPDAGGVPPLSLLTDITAARRGGSVTLRDPALLSLIGGPFDPFAHSVDLKPPGGAYNLPDLAIFLWRLKSYRVPVSQPAFYAINTVGKPGFAPFAACFKLHPMAEPMVLFNSHRFTADADPPLLASLDAVPGPMPAARLTQDSVAGHPEAYVHVTTYDQTTAPKRPAEPASDDVGLVLHLPQDFAGTAWTFRGANLCAWDGGLQPPPRLSEIVIDPDRGRLLFGVGAAEADLLDQFLLVSASYGFSGPTGAHPISRPSTPTSWQEQTAILRRVNFHDDIAGLQNALADLPSLDRPLIIEIDDSMTHELDLTAVSGIGSEGGNPVLLLGASLWIRAASSERPVIMLKQPLGFAPLNVSLSDADQAMMGMLMVRLEGLYLTRDTGFPADAPLIGRAALNQLHVLGCTLDPGGFLDVNGSRAPLWSGMHLTDDFGFTSATKLAAFQQVPDIQVERSITGRLAIGVSYTLTLSGSIVDAGTGVGETPGAFAVCAPTVTPEDDWGPELIVNGMTCFGRMRVTRATGNGGIWTGRLEAHDNQAGCISFSCFSGDADRIPPNHACVFATTSPLRFTSESFGSPGYAQLADGSDRHIREQGPSDDEMGAFGYLLNTHKSKNVGIRLREYTPIGVRPIVIPVT
ncbi:hypothetical protein [Bradyrhizobium iriomotense]|uniref:Uncharacterized protein n=1 Tax=Bradyrhizobium iriomotense TaxID=441950 RepID=A0ABQ6B3D9_9BRAD|nr:hypothetical protein [Bradyrhizobium iriomotense]GLR87961.1 hypothetical protein GCM10007857_46730 [Bradyrhizobium iriomotense]